MRKSEFLLAVAFLGSAAMSLWLWSELRAERGRHAELSARADSLPPPTPSPSTPVVAQPLPAKPPSPASQPPADPVANNQSRLEDEQRRLNDPAYRAATQRLHRVEYGSRKWDLMRALKITSEQADRILDYWASRDVIMQDSSLATAASSNLQQIEVANQRRARAMEAEEESLRAALGSDIVDRLAQYDASMQSRYQVNALRERVAQVGEPLRDEQIEPLVSLLHEEDGRLETEARAFVQSQDWSGDPAKGQMRFLERRLEMKEERNRRLHDTARGLLSEAQVRQLDEILEQQLESERAQVSLMKMRSKSTD